MIILKQENCKGCGLCVSVCKKDAYQIGRCNEQKWILLRSCGPGQVYSLRYVLQDVSRLLHL